MPAIPQKIRSGLIELRTNRGPLYVSPSVWQRIYLLWTFRNFHRLPQQVLNKRQRHLIQKLGSSAPAVRQRPLATRPIIGSVENVEIAGVEKEALAGSEKLVNMSPRGAVGRAVGFDSIPVGRNRSTPCTVASFPERPTADRLKSASAAQVQTAKPAVNRAIKLRGPRSAARRRLQGVLLATGGVAIAAVAFHLSEGRHKSATNLRPPAIMANAIQSPSGTSSHLTQAAAAPLPKAADRTTPVVNAALRTTAPAATIKPSPKQRSATPRAENPPPAESTAPERLHIAESPESFTYPLAPSAAVKGKVRLRAVLGTEGAVTDIAVLSGNPVLAKAASRAVRRWRYAPHEVNGKPAEAETDVVINFLGDEVVSVSFDGSD